MKEKVTVLKIYKKSNNIDRKVTIPLIGYFVEPPIPLITAINYLLYVCTSFTHLDVCPMQWLEDRKLNILELPSQGPEQRGVYGFGPPLLGVGDTAKTSQFLLEISRFFVMLVFLFCKLFEYYSQTNFPIIQTKVTKYKKK